MAVSAGTPIELVEKVYGTLAERAALGRSDGGTAQEIAGESDGIGAGPVHGPALAFTVWRRQCAEVSASRAPVRSGRRHTGSGRWCRAGSPVRQRPRG